MPSPLEPFFHAKSVAVVGGSDDPTRIGGRPIRYLLENGYRGEIFPVNPNRALVQGLRSVPTVADLPRPPDLAIIAVGRERVDGVVAECGERGIGSAIVFAAGYAETGDAGRLAQDALTRTAAAAGVRLLGPNSNGTMCPVELAPFALTPVLAEGLPSAGTLAVATQSAAVGTYWLRRIRERRLGMRYWAHTGNEADLGLADVMSYFLDDPDVRTVLCVLEQWRRPDKLPAILDRIRASGKAVIILPLGRTEMGRRAAISHTGSLVARRNDLVTGLARQAGAIIVHGLGEAVDVAATVDVVATVKRRIGILTPSGGLGVLLADAFATAGFEIPTFHEDLQARWRKLVPFCSPANPVDVTAQLINTPQLFVKFARDMVLSGQIDVLAVFLPQTELGDARTRALTDVASAARERGVVIAAVGAVTADVAVELRRHGVAIFSEPADAASALARLRREDFRAEQPASLTAPRPVGAMESSARRSGGSLRVPDDGILVTDEVTVKAILAAHGLTVVADEVVCDVEGALEAGRRVGFPVVLKRHVAGVAHKARSGGVVIGIENPADLVAAAAQLLAASPTNAAESSAVKLLVEPMVLGDELFVGVTRDPEWGSLALLGVGGGSVESTAGIAFRSVPVAHNDVASMIAELPWLAPLFARGPRVRAIDTLARTFAVLEQLLTESPRVRAIELNPVIVRPDGRCVVVDALAEWR